MTTTVNVDTGPLPATVVLALHAGARCLLALSTAVIRININKFITTTISLMQLRYRPHHPTITPPKTRLRHMH